MVCILVVVRERGLGYEGREFKSQSLHLKELDFVRYGGHAKGKIIAAKLLPQT